MLKKMTNQKFTKKRSQPLSGSRNDPNRWRTRTTGESTRKGCGEEFHWERGNPYLTQQATWWHIMMMFVWLVVALHPRVDFILCFLSSSSGTIVTADLFYVCSAYANGVVSGEGMPPRCRIEEK